MRLATWAAMCHSSSQKPCSKADVGGISQTKSFWDDLLFQMLLGWPRRAPLRMSCRLPCCLLTTKRAGCCYQSMVVLDATWLLPSRTSGCVTMHT